MSAIGKTAKRCPYSSAKRVAVTASRMQQETSFAVLLIGAEMTKYGSTIPAGGEVLEVTKCEVIFNHPLL